MRARAAGLPVIFSRATVRVARISASLKLTCVGRCQILNLSAPPRRWSRRSRGRWSRSTAPNNRIVNVHWLRGSDWRRAKRFGDDVVARASHAFGSLWLALRLQSAEFRTSVASLGLVTPWAATEGLTPLFFLKNLVTFLVVCSAVSPLFIFSWKTDELFFVHYCHFLLISLGCHSLWRVLPCTFFTCPNSFLHYSL